MWNSNAPTAVFLGYSGAYGFGSPEFQQDHNVGPLPQGKYTIEKAIDSPTLGALALPLTPDPANEMCGRSGFLIHGENSNHPGHSSDGCIILSAAARQAISASGDTELQVIS
jgi:hypothetical protein